MQAEPAEAPFSNNEYLFEVKWDGLRCLLFVGPDGGVRLQDRALRDVTYQFPEFGNLGGQVPPGTVLDGALVVTDGEGRPETGALRRRLAGPAGEDQRPAAYLAFDLLYLEGRPMLRKPLYQRKKQLHKVVGSGRHLYAPEAHRGGGRRALRGLPRARPGRDDGQAPPEPLRARPAEPLLAPGESGQVGPLRRRRLDRRQALRRAGRRLLRVGPAAPLRDRRRRLRAGGARAGRRPPARAAQRGQPARAAADHGLPRPLGAARAGGRHPLLGVVARRHPPLPDLRRAAAGGPSRRVHPPAARVSCWRGGRRRTAPAST